MWIVTKTSNIWYVTHKLFSCSDSSLLIPRSNCLLLAWCHLCCVWASICLMHAIVFNLRGMDHSEWKQEIIKQLLYQAITLKLEWNTVSRYFFLMSNYHGNCLLIALVLFVNLLVNSAIYFFIYCKSIFFGNPLGSSCVYW